MPLRGPYGLSFHSKVIPLREDKPSCPRTLGGRAPILLRECDPPTGPTATFHASQLFRLTSGRCKGLWVRTSKICQGGRPIRGQCGNLWCPRGTRGQLSLLPMQPVLRQRGVNGRLFCLARGQWGRGLLPNVVSIRSSFFSFVNSAYGAV